MSSLFKLQEMECLDIFFYGDTHTPAHPQPPTILNFSKAFNISLNHTILLKLGSFQETNIMCVIDTYLPELPNVEASGTL